MIVERDDASRTVEDAFAAVLGPGRGSDREDPWWRTPGKPHHRLAGWLDAAVAASHDCVLLEMFDDSSWGIEAFGGPRPMRAEHKHPEGAEGLLECAPDSHAMGGNETIGWVWRLR